MIRVLCICSYFLICYVTVLAVSAPMAAAQSKATEVQKEVQKVAGSEKPAHAPLADVSGDWQVSWQGRLGAEQCVLHLQQDGARLTGTLKTLRGVSPLSGTVDEKRVSFDVQFQGPHPFTTRFIGTIGTADSGKIDGTSQAVSVGTGGAYLGHAGEVVQPEHPWTATRAANPAAKN